MDELDDEVVFINNTIHAAVRGMALVIRKLEEMPAGTLLEIHTPDIDGPLLAVKTGAVAGTPNWQKLGSEVPTANDFATATQLAAMMAIACGNDQTEISLVKTEIIQN